MIPKMNDPLPITLTEERNMDVKLSGTSYAALDLNGVPVTETKEIKRGKGIVVKITTTPEGAAEILTRLRGRDKEDSGLTYEQRYACRVDAKRLDKQLNQVEEASAVAEAPATPTEETPVAEV